MISRKLIGYATNLTNCIIKKKIKFDQLQLQLPYVLPMYAIAEQQWTKVKLIPLNKWVIGGNFH